MEYSTLLNCGLISQSDVVSLVINTGAGEFSVMEPEYEEWEKTGGQSSESSKFTIT